MKTALETKAYQSRWGYHSCDYETFLKLKKLNKLYFKALKMRAEWHRWYRKEPQNRVICKYKRDEQGRRISKEVIGPRPEPNIDSVFLKKIHVKSRWDGEYDTISFLGFNIVKEYQNARIPRKKENVIPMDVTKEEIEALYQLVK